MMLQFSVGTARRADATDITAQIRALVQQSGFRSGVCHVFVPHTTAGITINEGADPAVAQDLLTALERVVPWVADYAHLEGNAAAHVKASLVGSSVVIPVEDGRLQLGTWQAVFLCEFDGPRERRVWLKLIGE